MKKAFEKKVESNKFKTSYMSGQINTEVILNILNSNDKNVEVIKWFNFLNYENNYDLMFSMSLLAEEALKNKFGQHDFKFDSSESCKIYVLEDDGLTFICPYRREVVISESINDTIINKIINFEKNFLSLCLDYAIKNKERLNDFIKNNIEELIIKEVIKNNKINFNNYN